MAKKDFTKADNAIDRMFTKPKIEQQTHDTKDTKDSKETKDTKESNNTKDEHVAKHTNVSNNANNPKYAKVSHKSKHYDDRGPRRERLGLLLDGQLKNDLALLSGATGSKSVNDLIVTVLLEYVETEDSQNKIKIYKSLLEGTGEFL